VEVVILNQEGGPQVVAAIELVSPSNKDRPATRRAFVAKMSGYLQQGMALAVIDLVTSRTAHLYMCIEVSLEETYLETCGDQRIAVA
jgi:hypothetical protein